MTYHKNDIVIAKAGFFKKEPQLISLYLIVNALHKAGFFFE